MFLSSALHTPNSSLTRSVHVPQSDGSFLEDVLSVSFTPQAAKPIKGAKMDIVQVWGGACTICVMQGVEGMGTGKRE
jgi:hypothetical protein